MLVECTQFTPFKSFGFHCNDPKLKFKNEGETVSTNVLLFVSFVVPWLVVSIFVTSSTVQKLIAQCRRIKNCFEFSVPHRRMGFTKWRTSFTESFVASKRAYLVCEVSTWLVFYIFGRWCGQNYRRWTEATFFRYMQAGWSG